MIVSYPLLEPFPRCVLEVSPQEVQEYYSPRDFKVGETMRLMGRTLRLYDCDSFTKSYFQSNHPEMEVKRVEPPRAEEAAWDTERVRHTLFCGCASCTVCLEM